MGPLFGSPLVGSYDDVDDEDRRGAVADVRSVEQWKTEVVDASWTSVVDFYANWCGPCRAVAPYFDDLANAQVNAQRQSGTQPLRFFRVNVDDVPEAAAFASISALPTFQVWSGGKLVTRSVGADKEKLRKLVEEDAWLVAAGGGGTGSGGGSGTGSGGGSGSSS